MKFFSLLLLSCASFSLFSLQGAELSHQDKEDIGWICEKTYGFLKTNAWGLKTLRSRKFEPSAVVYFFEDLLTNPRYKAGQDLGRLQSVITDINDLTDERRSLVMNELSDRLAKTDKAVKPLEITMNW